MALLVVAYPQFMPTDYAWIQALHQQHDAQCSLIAPHFTLVFPVNTIAQDDLIAHTTERTKQAHAIPFIIRCAVIVKDAFSPMTHLFLVPDEGYSALVKLHDALYTHPLADALRLDVPFIPHITVGAHANPYVCKAAADTINHQHICIQGHISALDIITYENKPVASVTRIALASSANGIAP